MDTFNFSNQLNQGSNEAKEEEHQENGKATNEDEKELQKNQGCLSFFLQHLVQHQGFWLVPAFYGVEAVKFLEDHFQARPNDIILSSFPKSGTTWLRALIFSIVNRAQFDFSDHPLLTINPHDCFPFLDGYIHEKKNNPDIDVYDQETSSQRLFATHFPYSFLPDSIKKSPSKIVHVCRNPKDVFVSLYLYAEKLKLKEFPLPPFEAAFELFCNGLCPYGPYWDHVLEYWKASLERPENVLFLKYEDLKKEPSVCVKKLAEFFGKPFAAEEEERKVVEEIVKMCSFESLSKLEVNSSLEPRQHEFAALKNQYFFRKGEVGDGVNHLTPEMVQRLDRITEEKFKGSGLKF